MKKHTLQSPFSDRQYMLSRDFEIYYYNDKTPAKVDFHTHDYYEFYFLPFVTADSFSGSVWPTAKVFIRLPDTTRT